jgi:hypothetical protein
VVSLTNALGNVNSVTSESNVNFTVNSGQRTVFTEVIDGTVTNVGNISGDGYALVGRLGTGPAAPFSYSGAGNIVTVFAVAGNITTGSNSVTGLTNLLNFFGDVSLTVTDIPVGAFWMDGLGFTSQPFPPGTQVTSIDAANNTVFMSANATANLTLNSTAAGSGFFTTGAYDSDTGQTLAFISAADLNAGNAQTINQIFAYPRSIYGYSANGFTTSNFDVYTLDDANSYALTADISSLFEARTQLEAPRTVFNMPRGLIVGNGDLTNRAENDNIGSFGINVLWDGVSTIENNPTPLTQILVKNYTDNNLQGANDLNRASFGPRLFFTASEGNKNEYYTETYPRKGLELGRVSWWGPSQTNPAIGTAAPSGWISGVTGQDHTVNNSGLGMYFANSPDVANLNRSLYLANTKGNTLIAGGIAGNNNANIMFAPLATNVSNGDSPAMYDYATIVGKQYGKFGYANMSAQTGSQLTVTNGGALGAGVTGDMNLTLHRSDNAGNVILTSLVGINYLGGQNPDRIRFPGLLTLPAGTPVTINGFTDATVAGALNGNVFYVSSIVSAGIQNYRLYSDSGLTTPVNLSVSNINAGPGTFEFALPSAGITDQRWDIALEEQSEDLKFKANGTTVATITESGNINLATNATINYDAVYGCFHNMANVTAAAADTVYEFQWPNVHINTNRVTVESNSQITIGQEGAYVFSLEMQAENTDNQDRTAFIWLAKNGTDIEESCVRVTLLKEWKQVIVKEWIVNSLNANDYIEVRFAVDNISGIQLTSIPAQASPYARPAVPSAVITVTPAGA